VAVPPLLIALPGANTAAPASNRSPTAWINHGWRTENGARWWNGYREPAPQARYFDAVDIASDKTHNAHQNKHYGLDG
jgi:hypothetical protein